MPEVPDDKETALAKRLGAAGLAQIDANLLDQADNMFHKAARIIADAIKEGGFPLDDTHCCVHLRRLIALADSGTLEWAGNLRRPRFSEVRLPADTWERVREEVQERKRAKEQADFEDAVSQTEQHPDDPKAWRALARAHNSNDDYPAAITAMTRAIELGLSASDAYWDRGRYALMAGDYDLAIADFSQGLVLSDQLNNDDLREELHFLRAEAFFQLGRKTEARADLEHVRDDCVSWTIQVRSKDELLALCAE
ncbi:MAG: tetratricopeptide repeat protein [Polyangiaceae bacterium]|nr:tetratricopeptide repeat protein [Polyangiaceae bacterium]